MPTTAFLLRLLSVAFQYGILFFLFYFVFLVLRYIQQDMKSVSTSALRTKDSLKEAVVTVLEAEGPDGDLQGKRFAFTESLSIGRGADNDIVLHDNYVSHHHAVLSLVNNLYAIEDLESVNHTYVNGNILQGRAYLQPGDLIHIGLVTVRFER